MQEDVLNIIQRGSFFFSPLNPVAVSAEIGCLLHYLSVQCIRLSCYRKNVTKIHCATIEQTMEVLTNPYFTNPKQIIIHTGTNNIQTEQKGIADKLSQLTDTAQQKFPHTKIILSCLLPRKDISNHIIQNINTELAAKTSSKPNIHLAQHPSITPEHLYDNKHLNKQGVSHLLPVILS
uniref:SGNH hydrolase-type esterase domain-containing protein n=1 Tax=Leptobrachium leishanense TaxID=445787 RepID=A0A8C5W891_9ANUR